MLKKIRYSFISGVTATIVVFVPVTSSWAYADSTVKYVKEYIILEIGSQGEDVIELKEALNTLGFDIYEENDLFDEDTEEQVIRLQEFYEFDATGFVDEDLFEFILAEAEAFEKESNEDLNEESEETLEEESVEHAKLEEIDAEESEIKSELSDSEPSIEEPKVETEEKVEEEEVTTLATATVDVDSKDVLKNGDSDPRVIELKIKLEIMGFKVSNTPTQLYGSITARKVSEFQEAYGLAVTGMADEVTLTTLSELANGPLRQGMYRDDVVQLKIDLEKVGFSVSNNPTTYFGPSTAAQLKAFQEAYGLTADGIAGQATLDKLNELTSNILYAGINDAQVIQLKINLGIMGFHVSNNPNGNYGPITTQKVKEFQKAYGLPVSGIADQITINRLNELATGPLRQGMYRDDVIQLKKDLEAVGFPVSSNPTTYFGPSTATQLKAFQKAHGLTADGVAYPSTLTKLKQLTSDSLYLGMNDPRVVELKINLAIMGFPVSSNPNGVYGPITRQKVREFQAAYGLVETGVADQATLSRLHELATGPLRIGMYREDVVQLKLDLGRVGFAVPGDTTTYFGPLTESRLKAFQKAHGLKADGVATQATLNKLKELTSGLLVSGMSDPRVVELKINLAIMGFPVSNNPNQNYGPVTAQKVREFQAAYGLPETGAPDQHLLDLLSELANGPLQLGMYREDVIQLKMDLGRAGFPVPGDMTTYFGPLTESRLKAFQEAHGLEATGIADKTTLAKLAEAAALEKITYTQSNFTLAQSISRQLALNPPPQTDAYRNAPAFVSASFVDIEGIITGSTVNLRTAPTLDNATIETSVSRDTKMIVLQEVNGDTTSGSNKWYEVRFNGKTLYAHSSLMKIVGKATANTNIREAANTNSHVYSTVSAGRELNIVSIGSSWHQITFSTWRNAKQEDFVPFMDPNNNDRFQHLVLSSSAGVPADQLNRLLSGKGSLHGSGQAFINAGAQYAVNEVYLISHALLETGHGSSTLATGIEVGRNSSGNLELVTANNRSRLTNIRTTYNMFGIGAVDADPHRQGAFHAYNEGWFTPEAAIIGGAKFIGSRYIHNQYQQNTLYKMRWNPANPGFPQYATDIGWAVKQVPAIKNLYPQLDNPLLHFDIPVYK
jgi:mannosyl-glycoprotein endo-beta-N-acetylglucosaminidase